MKNAGRLAHFAAKWREITNDNWVLDTIQSYRIEFVGLPCQYDTPKEIPFSRTEAAVISCEIEKLLQKGAVKETCHTPGEFISNMFLRPKKDGSFRPIINLRGLNKFVKYKHFKMETIRSALHLIRPDCFMASIDLKDAYFSIPIAKEHRKFLRFIWQSRVYEFTCMPFGLSCAPRVFTKVMKPLVASLRRLGHESCDYLDDSLLIGSNESECLDNVQARIELTEALGFIINTDKSVTTPTNEITFLGFVLNSTCMTISIPPDKANRVADAIIQLLALSRTRIREVAKVIGLLVSCEIAMPYGPLFRRTVENEKNVALAENRGDLESKMILSCQARSDLTWWRTNILSSSAPIHRQSAKFIIETDASEDGWGANFNGQTIGGRWSPEEAMQHINYLEMKACYLALDALFNSERNTHIHMRSDNTTAVAYIQHFGGSQSPKLNSLAREIWLWCICRGIWLSIAYLPGMQNTIADFASRHFHDDIEWQLHPGIFKRITQRIFVPDIDLFASRLNHQVDRYVAWHPDSGAAYIDAFSLNWRAFKFYAFPPFCLISKVLTKIQYDKADGILIVPLWQTQPWFPKMLKLLVQSPVILPRQSDLLSLSYSDRMHPLRDRLRLVACHLSGKPSDCRAYQEALPTLSSHLGDHLPKNVTGRHWANGFTSVLAHRRIQFEQILPL